MKLPDWQNEFQYKATLFYREAVNSYLGRRERHESNDGGGRRRYLDVLLDQVQNKLSNDIERRKLDDERMVNHFQSFDTYWGRPGHGAIKESGVQKENLMKILHYPSQKVKNLHFAE